VASHRSYRPVRDRPSCLFLRNDSTFSLHEASLTCHSLWSAQQLSCSQLVWDKLTCTPAAQHCCRGPAVVNEFCLAPMCIGGEGETMADHSQCSIALCSSSSSRVTCILEWWTDNSCTLIQCHYSWCLTARFTDSLCQCWWPGDSPGLVLWAELYGEL